MMSKYMKALLVGVGKTPKEVSFANDVHAMTKVLATNDDGSNNFECKSYVHGEKDIHIDAKYLMGRIEKLFASDSAVTLFYFTGHGRSSAVGASLVTMGKDDKTDVGVPFSFLLSHAIQALNHCITKEVIILLDCCFSGDVGDLPFFAKNSAILPKGLSIVTASSSREFSYSTKDESQGVFTKHLVEGLEGGAADHLGRVTAAGLFDYTDSILGAWEQRPTFKAHISNMYPLRQCEPIISRDVLNMIVDYFPQKAPHDLTPGYEDTAGNDPKLVPIFKILQQYNRVGLVKPSEPHEHMYDAAMEGGSCYLTPWGRYYWELVKKERI